MLRMTTTADPIATGVKEVAEALGGGIHEGSLVLIEGEAKSGKSVVSQHIVYGILHSKESAVACYITGNSAETLMAQMDSMSLDAKQDFVTDRLRIYPIGSGDVPRNAEKFLRLIVNHISELPERFSLVVVDSVTTLMNRVSPATKVNFLHACKELCEQGRSIVLVVDSHVLEGKTLYRAHAMSDYYLRLKSKDMMLETGQVDDRVVKILEVSKLAGADRPIPESIKFEIKPKVGIQILPFVKVRI
jgi:flagellar protein FlaH